MPEMLYHGMPEKLAVIRPHVPHFLRDGARYPDGNLAVVCATETFAVATYMAIMPRGHGLRWGYKMNQLGGVEFFAHPELKARLEAGAGYVAELDPDTFALHDGSYPDGWPVPIEERKPRMPEWRSIEPQTVDMKRVHEVGYHTLRAALDAEPHTLDFRC